MLISILQFLSDFSVDHPFWTSIFTVFFTAQFCKWLKSFEKRLPPGPLGLPVAGHLPFLRYNAHSEISKWHQTYGSVYSMSVGSRNVLVLGDFKSIRQANLNEDFCGNARGLLKMSGRVEHIGAMNPKDRKESSNFTRDTLKALAMGGNKLEDFVTEEITKMLDLLDSGKGRSFLHIGAFVQPAIRNIMTYLIFGRKPGENPDLSGAVYDYIHLSADRFRANALAYFLPLLSPVLPHLDPKAIQIKRNLSELVRVIGWEIEAHEKAFDPNSLNDYMDYFLAEKKRRIGDPSTFTNAVLKGNTLLLLASGIDTTVSAIEWVLLLMAKHQDVQDKVYQEIVESWGQTSWPAWKDMKPMPYLEAVLMEAGRWKTVTPLGTPHLTQNDTRVCNYDIPRNTLVINNLQSLHMDSELWDEPDVFNPDRFMSADKKTAKAPEYFAPLSYGNRTCPGDSLAKMEVVTVVAAVLQHFKVIPPDCGLNLEEKLSGLVLQPESPYFRVQPRNGI